MELESSVLERVESYESLSRWERSELGRFLRLSGLSYGEIMELIPVKKSTLATWCRDITLTEDQMSAIKERRAPEPGVPRDTQRKRRAEIEAIRLKARIEAQSLFGEPLWVAGVALYWGEGAKTRNRFEMANADPLVLRTFIRWVREFHDRDAEFALQINLHANNDEKTARQYWEGVLELPGVKFHKAFIKPDGTGHRKNHLAHGVCRVRVSRSADAWNRTIA